MEYPFLAKVFRTPKGAERFHVFDEVIHTAPQETSLRTRYPRPKYEIEIHPFLQELLPAEKPANHVNSPQKKITAATIIKSCWDIVSKNPLISTIVATIIATVILKYYHVL